MSWWVALEDANGETLQVRTPWQDGGTQALGGTTECDLNMTYNYGKWLRKYGVHPNEDLHGQKAGDTAIRLEAARHRLLADAIENERHGVVEGVELGCSDYWHDCPANVARAVSHLVAWTREHPDGIWRVN